MGNSAGPPRGGLAPTLRVLDAGRVLRVRWAVEQPKKSSTKIKEILMGPRDPLQLRGGGPNLFPPPQPPPPLIALGSGPTKVTPYAHSNHHT